MNAKILLLAFSAVAFTSCSTAYKSGQTPDDVYYSPVRPADETRKEERYNTQPNYTQTTVEEKRIRMTIRDRRWRDLDDDYDYSYNYSPYRYCYSGYNNYGYYYNPYYYSRPLYSPRTEVNTTPRMVNLNTYKNYTAAVTSTNPKTGSVTTTYQPGKQYNNSNNNGGSRIGNAIRQVITPSASSNTNSSSSNNNTRTYTPSNNNSSSSSSSSSSGSGSSGTPVARPGRGGN